MNEDKSRFYDIQLHPTSPSYSFGKVNPFQSVKHL